MFDSTDVKQPLELDVVDLLSVSPTPPNWLLGRLLLRDSCAVIGGEPKSGKTWLALHMAVSLAAGQDVLGTWAPSQAGKALLYSPEGGPLVASNRLHQLCWGHGIDPGKLSGRLLGVKGRLHVDDDADYDRLRERIAKHGPDLLLLDPLIGVHTAPENEADKLQPVLDRIRDLREAHPGLAVVLVHHTNKGSKGGADGYGLRGSSALAGWYDTRISLRRCNDGIRRVDVEHRCAEAPVPQGYRLRTGRGGIDELESVRLERCDAPTPTTKDNSSEAGKGDKRNVRRRKICAEVDRQPGKLTAEGIAEALSMSRRTVQNDVKGLMEEDKLLAKNPQGKLIPGACKMPD